MDKLVLCLFLIFTPALHAHHSDVGIDMDSILAINGKVLDFNWRYPHVYMIIEAANEQGELIEWEVQLGSISILMRRGWTADTLQQGDQVRVGVHPRANGQPYAIMETLDKDGALRFNSDIQIPDGSAISTSVAGKWLADESSYPDYPGGYDGLFRALLPLNDKAKQAVADFDPMSSENPEAQCAGRPTPGAFVSSNIYLMEIEVLEGENIVMINSERDAEERTVYMDGRPHPDQQTLFSKGHSIGYWEDDTLVVDTANFSFHRSPYQFGVPSSALKHVTERYRLNENGTRLEAEFILEDPEYLTEPMSHSRSLIYSPDWAMNMNNKCDPESASRFLGLH
jgi:hypothetical protein